MRTDVLHAPFVANSAQNVVKKMHDVDSLGGITTYSPLWLKVAVYDANVTDLKPEPIRLAQSTIGY